MELLDTTLREGEQCYGVFFSVEDKVRIAGLLDAAGVDFIEAGHPASAPSIRQAAAEIARLALRARRIGHARLDRNEIRLVRDLGLPWVGLFSGINPMSLQRYGTTRAAAVERIERSVLSAKDLGLSVRFTVEDASRTDPGELIELYGRLRERGVDRLSYADTVGADTPERLKQLSRRLGSALPFADLHFHFHDDQGRALVNAVTAAELGAQCMDGSIMGIGERMGIVRLGDLMDWRVSGSARPDAQSVRRDAAMGAAHRLVASSIDRSRFSRRRFAHKSGIHIHGVCSDPRQYEHADPAASGSIRLIVLSKLIGRSGLRLLLSRHGFEANDEGLGRLLRAIKADDRLELADPAEIIGYFERCCARRIPVASGAA